MWMKLSVMVVTGAAAHSVAQPPTPTPTPTPATASPGTPPDATATTTPTTPPVAATPPASAVGVKEFKLDAGTFGAISARSIGPAFLSGRVSDIAVNPKNHSEWYVAVASGGVWKTVNGGVTFSPIFDRYGSFSIGCVTLDPTNPAVVWVGSGENNSQRSVSWGDGVYVSRDGGANFSNVGLKLSAHIGMIAVDPRSPDTVFVAAMGPLWSSGGERGLYKTTDGGTRWERVLHVSEETGINEVYMDPRDPEIMFATAYQRRRHVWTLVNGGPESAVYKSTDAGKTWRKVPKGLPGGDVGRIGLAISPANPEVIYAIAEAGEGGGVFRSSNRGESWEKRCGYMTTSPQYYNELFADPQNVDRVYAMDTFMQVSTDGGATFHGVGEKDKHVDNHALWIDPSNTEHLIAGCDGGLYETFDRGTWRHVENLSVMQFYRVATDTTKPFYNVYGGTQDNNSIGGPSRTTDRAGVSNEDWFVTAGGDGFASAVDPLDPNTVYAESQDGGLVRFDRRSGEEVDIKPREKATDKPLVFNWDTPLLISPHKHTRLYFAGNYLLVSEDRGGSWTTISGDLTRGLDRNQLRVMGKVQKPDVPSKNLSTSIFGNAVALCESPLVEGLIYVGTDDGLVHVTEDGGKTWRKIENFPVVPDMTYVSDLEASRHGKDTVFATFDNHKMGDFKPYVLRSDDRGRTWKPMMGNLPERDVVYTIVEDHVNPRLLFTGTEFGAYYTVDGGEKWVKVAGLPTIAVRDLTIQREQNDLVMATFGRGFYVVDDYSPLRAATPEMMEQKGTIFPVRAALSYVPRSRLGNNSGRGWSGANYYSAKNPAFGANITYYLKDKVQSRKERRKEAEGKEGWKYPTLDEFRAEDHEIEPQVLIAIRDTTGAVVRRLSVPGATGVTRVSWNLRLPDTNPVGSGAGGAAPWDRETHGPLAPPGVYTAQLSKTVDGMTTELSEPQQFEVVALDQTGSPGAAEARTAKFEMEKKAWELSRAVKGASRLAGELDGRLASLRKASIETPGAEVAILRELEVLRTRLNVLQLSLDGDGTARKRAVASLPSISERIGGVVDGLADITQAPTGAHREQYQLAADEFEKVLPQLAQLAAEIAALDKRLDAAGAPWTPGRVPEWKNRK